MAEEREREERKNVTYMQTAKMPHLKAFTLQKKKKKNPKKLGKNILSFSRVKKKEQRNKSLKVV